MKLFHKVLCSLVLGAVGYGALFSVPISSVHGDIVSTCRSLLVPTADQVPFKDFTPGFIFVVIREEFPEVITALSDASESGSITTGVPALDSLGTIFGLKHIESVQDFEEAFNLRFDLDADLSATAGAYCGVPYFDAVIVEVFQPTAVADTKGWGRIKRRLAEQDRPE